MKGVKRLCGLFLVLFTIFGLSSVVFSNDVSAVDHASFTSYWRSYYIEGSAGVVNQQNFDPNSQSLHTLLLYDANEYVNKYLKGFSVDFDVPDTTQYQHKTLVVKLTLVQYGPANMPGEPKSTLRLDVPNVLAVNTTSGDKFVSNKCKGAYVNHQGFPTSYYVTYTCSINWDDFASLYNVQLTIGTTRNATTSSPDVGMVGPMANSAYNPQSGTIQAYWLNYELTGSTDPSYNNIVVISEGVDEMLERDAQDRADLQNSSDSASDSADSAGEDVSNAGEQLLYVLTTIYGYLLNPPESNCKISGNTGFMNLGDIDLCSLSPPPAINVIGTLLLIGLCVPFAVSAVSMLIKLVEGVFTT